MNRDKNYFHVTPEHLTSDRLAQRSTKTQTPGTHSHVVKSVLEEN